MQQGFTPHTGWATTTARLNIRTGAPLTTAPVGRTVESGARLRVLGIGPGQRVGGNDTWYAGEADCYFWSGACRLDELDPSSASGTPGKMVRRRPDGSILPLGDNDLKRVFGDFRWAPGARRGAIRILDGWASANLIKLRTPILEPVGFPAVQVHAKAVASLMAAFQDIEAAGLENLILSCAGTFVPRHKGWDPDRGLSSHSWGIAIDLNAQWNGYGVQPAPLGAKGSVRDLVPILERHGFAWGGYFSPPYEDGMHFELARLDL
ncbi:M15 family metallopeptidase [Chthonobacter albigriseus]|uniref:M15 family metallopeptidase n=1 Tax=Chthonobacter albigriseus TaxID=1683161 RepID=UPI0015EFD26E|nr:M15 family metallopeptidase [Chthonobacter albigriseus]